MAIATPNPVPSCRLTTGGGRDDHRHLYFGEWLSVLVYRHWATGTDRPTARLPATGQVSARPTAHKQQPCAAGMTGD